MILYKYLSPDRIDVLENSLIRYTQPALFSDPFDSRPFISDVGPLEVCKLIIGPEKFKSPGEWPVSESSSKPTQSEEITFSQAIFCGLLGAGVGILSLTERPDNLLMWSHYARDHEGFVVGFDCEHSYFAELRDHSKTEPLMRKVEYSKDRPGKGVKDLSATEVYFTKSIDWEYEQEWRIIRWFLDADEMLLEFGPPIGLFEFPPSCMDSVIIGCRASTETTKSIREILKTRIEYSHVRLYETQIHQREFRLVMKEVAA